MTFAGLALICLVALAGPLLALPRGLRVPVVIGEFLVGLVLGRTGFGVLSPEEPTFAFAAEVGFALVMLVAGSHVPLQGAVMRTGLRTGALRATGIGVVAAVAGVVIAAAFGTGHGALYAVLLASSSAAILMPSLTDVPLTGRSMVAAIPQIAVADAACIVALPLVIDPARAGRTAIGALLVAVAGLTFWLLLRWGETSGRRQAVHEVSQDRGLAIELRSVLVALFAMAAVAQALDVSIMLAGFVTGLALAGIGGPRRVSKQLFALTEGFFGPIFYVWLGTSIDLHALAAHPQAILLGLALGLTALAVHGLGAFTGQPWPLALATGAQLGVPIAAATLGAGEGLLEPGESTAFLLGALVTIAAVTMVSRRVATIARAEARG